MKNFKKLIILVVVVFLTACNSSSDNSITLEVSGSIDVTQLPNLAGNDATKIVSLNGESAATQTTEIFVGDSVSYEINTGSATTEIVILDFFFTSGNREFWENNIQVNFNTQATPTTATLTLLGGAVGDEAKFGFTFAVKTNGILDLNTTYIVDPKIRVRG